MSDRQRNDPELVEPTGAPDIEAMSAALADFLRAAGLDAAAAGEAPEKAATAWARELLAGYWKEPSEILTTWPDQTSDMVILRGVPFVSVCAHHLLPFYGVAHVAYLPDGRLTGLSRLAELVDCVARRLQVQERITEQLADLMMQGLRPRGAACLLEAAHDCVGARSLENRGSRVQTVAYRGEFADSRDRQDSFLRLVLEGAGHD